MFAKKIKLPQRTRTKRVTLGLCLVLAAATLAAGIFVRPESSQASTYSDAVTSEPTLLYYWPMTESSGSTLAATVGGINLNVTGATVGVAGQVGNAVSFDGINDFAATASSLNLTTYSKIVVEALVMTNAYDSTPHYAWEFSPNLTAITGGFNFAVDGGGGGATNLINNRIIGNVGATNATYTRLTTSTWHHVVAVYNKGAATNEPDLYVDGTLLTPAARPTNANNTNNFGNQILYIMSRAGSSLFTAGKMQQLAIYSDLSSGEILAHAQASGVVPLAAGTLSLTSRTSSTVSLSWTDSTAGNGAVTQQLQRSPLGAGSWTNVSGATTSPATDTTATASTDYDYRVAYTDATPTTAYSNTVSVKTDSDPGDAYRQDVEAEPTLLYYWPLDEPSGTVAMPLVGSTNLTVTGATPNVSGATEGAAMSFDGVNDFAATAATLNLNAYHKVVVEALMKVDSYDTTPRYSWEFSANMTTVTGGFNYSVDGGSNGASAAAFTRVNGDVGFNTAAYSRMTAGSWHHVVTVYDKSASTNEVDVYIDGSLLTATSRPNTSNNTNVFGNQTLYLMSRAGTSLFVPGDLQHLAIYSDLSSDEILAHALDTGLLSITPGTLSQDDATSTTATLSWTAPTLATGSVQTQLQRSAAGANTWSDISGATASPATDTGLSPNTDYDYRVAYTDDVNTVYSDTLTVSTLAQYPTFAPNNAEAIVAPYDTAFSGTGNFGTGTNTSKETIEIGHPYRIRENGTIDQVRLYTANKTGLSAVYIKIWRKNGTTYDLVGTSNNILSDMTAGAITTITLTSPITDVHEGDYYGFRLEGNGTNALQLVGKSLDAVSSYSIVNSTAATTAMDWAAQSNVPTGVPIELYMQAPQMVLIGDSLIAGRTANYSFIENTELTCIVCAIGRQLHDITGYTYQNMGVSSQTSFDIKERFDTDVLALHPRIAIVEGGANDFVDYNADTSEPFFLTHWTHMLDDAQADDDVSVVLVVLMFPCTSCLGRMDIRDQWNDDLIELASHYSKARIVDVRSYVGQDRGGAYAGNLWDIQPAYVADGVHLNAAGYGQVAQAIADTLDTTPPTITSITSSNASGTYGIGQTITLTANFSEPVTSVGNVTLTLNTSPTRACTFTLDSATSGSCAYIVQAGDAANPLNVTVSGTIQDFMENALTNFTPTAALSSSKSIVVDTFVAPLPPSATPTVTQPIIARDTVIAGTSSEADGTDIEVFVNDVSVATTTVSGGAWSSSIGTGELQAGEVVTAIATAAGDSPSAPSSGITVLARTSPAPTINPVTAGDVTVTGTSAGADGTDIVLFRTRDSATITLLSTTVTSGAWSVTGLGGFDLQTGDILTAQARIDTNNDSAVNSDDTYSADSSETIVGGRVSSAPAVAELVEGATSVTGTSTGADGTVIEVFVNGVSVGTTTVTGGTWSLSPVTALGAANEVTATATFDTNNDSIIDSSDTPSALSSTVIVAGLPVTAAPAVDSPLTAGDSAISGTSSEADGTSIEIFVDGVSVDTVTVTSGAWTSTVSASELQANETVTAQATASGKNLSALSTGVVVGSRISSAPVVEAIIAADTSISGTSTAADGSIIAVLNSRSGSLGTTSVTSHAWTLAGLSATALHGSDVITATATIDTNNDGVVDGSDVASGASSEEIVQDLTSPAPEVSTPSTGATSISGTSTGANGTVIEVFRTRGLSTSSLGTTTVTSHAWTVSGLDSSSFQAGDVMTAKARIDTNNDGVNDSSDTFSASSSDAVIAALGEKDILSFSFPEGTGVITGTNISVVVAYGSPITALVPTITIDGQSINPASGVAQDFSSPVVYEVTAADSSTQDYTVTVTEYVTPPTITSPIARGTGPISGTAPGAEDGAMITLYRNNVSFANTTVTSHAWTIASTDTRSSGDRFTATVTVDTNHDDVVDGSDSPSAASSVVAIPSGGTTFTPPPPSSGDDGSGSGEVAPPPAQVPPPEEAPSVPEIILDPQTGQQQAPDSEATGISPFDQNLREAISQLASGWYVRSPSFNTVYYVTPTFTRQPFWDAQTYFTWADSFQDVVWVTDATLPTLPIDSPMLPKAGVVLMKTPGDPKVYAISTESSGQPSLRYIPDEATAIAVYGSSWADYVIDMDPGIFRSFTLGPDVTATEHVDTANMKKRSELYEH